MCINTKTGSQKSPQLPRRLRQHFAGTADSENFQDSEFSRDGIMPDRLLEGIYRSYSGFGFASLRPTESACWPARLCCSNKLFSSSDRRPKARTFSKQPLYGSRIGTTSNRKAQNDSALRTTSRKAIDSTHTGFSCLTSLRPC